MLGLKVCAATLGPLIWFLPRRYVTSSYYPILEKGKRAHQPFISVPLSRAHEPSLKGIRRFLSPTPKAAEG